jgi:predicted pyridoxine 5'-phosphate oxidase superfamily flavin-nucleotide-binding protein
MANLYGDAHRALQDRFDTRRLADRLAEVTLHTELTDEDRGFIESRDMFWLASVDPEGRPTVSYKGGHPGFVRVVDPATLAFPCYDGNGMYYSMGNIVGHPSVGLLFMDLDKPFRIRVQGQATLHHDDPLRATFPGAQFVVRVAVTEIFPNCPRYIHRHEQVQRSRYVPEAGTPAPLAGWKRIDLMQDALPHYDKDRVEPAGGVLPIEAWMGKVASGDPEA